MNGVDFYRGGGQIFHFSYGSDVARYNSAALPITLQNVRIMYVIYVSENNKSPAVFAPDGRYTTSEERTLLLLCRQHSAMYSTVRSSSQSHIELRQWQPTRCSPTVGSTD